MNHLLNEFRPHQVSLATNYLDVFISFSSVNPFSLDFHIWLLQAKETVVAMLEAQVERKRSLTHAISELAFLTAESLFHEIVCGATLSMMMWFHNSLLGQSHQVRPVLKLVRPCWLERSQRPWKPQQIQFVFFFFFLSSCFMCTTYSKFLGNKMHMISLSFGLFFIAGTFSASSQHERCRNRSHAFTIRLAPSHPRTTTDAPRLDLSSIHNLHFGQSIDLERHLRYDSAYSDSSRVSFNTSLSPPNDTPRSLSLHYTHFIPLVLPLCCFEHHWRMM